MGAISFKRSSLEDFNKYNSLLVGNAAFVPSFDPANLNPDLWLDASDASTITESGGSVSQWDNKGTLENVIQPVSASQPTTGVSTINGLNVLDFDEDYFQNSNKSQWKFMHDGTEYFVAMVFKITSSGLNHNLIYTGGNSDKRVGIAVVYQDLNKLYAGVGNGSDQAFVLKVEDTGFLPRNQILIYSQLSDPDNGTIADRTSYFRNSTEGAVSNSSSGSPSTSDSTHDLYIGSRLDGATATIGQMAELIVVSGADATESNRQEVVDYLNDKWGVF